MRILGVVLAFLAITGCGRKTEFLHHLQDIPPQFFDTVHKLKELQGENRVDILWVVDNSGSMGSYQNELIKNADVFITDFVSKNSIDWKMGLISSDKSQEPFLGFTPSTLFTHTSPSPVKTFQKAVAALGTMGDSYEHFFEPVKKHLTAYPKFLRDRATLALIFLTDAPEQSQNISATQFLNFIKSKKGSLDKVVSYGVFAAQDFGCVYTDENWSYKGSKYEAVIKATKGKYFKLCGTDFGKNLADLGKDLVDKVKRPFIQLKDRPVVATVKVSYRGEDLPGGPLDSGGYWIYDFDYNRVVFHNLDFAPGDTEEVTISFQLADEIMR